jgi:hypothetical protein
VGGGGPPGKKKPKPIPERSEPGKSGGSPGKKALQGPSEASPGGSGGFPPGKKHTKAQAKHKCHDSPWVFRLGGHPKAGFNQPGIWGSDDVGDQAARHLKHGGFLTLALSNI